MKFAYRTSAEGNGIVRLHKDDGTPTEVECLMAQYEPYVYHTLTAFLPPDTKAAEIGSFKGGSACVLWSGLHERSKRMELWCHDVFEPFQLHDTLVDIDTCFDDAMRTWGVSTVHKVKGDSKDTHAIHAPESLDYCFIDGDHTYAGAAKDIENFMTKVKPGGWLVIQDSHGEVLDAVRDVLSPTDWKSMLVRPPVGHYVTVCHRNPARLQEFGDALKRVMEHVLRGEMEHVLRGE